MDFDTTSLYPSTLWDEKATKPKIEMVYALAPGIKDDFVEKCLTQTSTRVSAI